MGRLKAGWSRVALAGMTLFSPMCADPSMLADEAEYLPVLITEKHKEHRYVQALWQATRDKFVSLA